MATYLKFHQLERSPFEGANSDRLVLATEALRHAFAEIKTGLDEGAARVCLSGGPGIGKSSLARALPKLLAKQARCALVRDPNRDWAKVKASITKQLNLEAGQLSRASLLAARPEGQQLAVVIDEAEHIPAESLEQLDVMLGYRDDNGEQLVQCILLANLENAPRGHDVPLLWWLDQITTRQLMMAPIPEKGLRSYVEKHLAKAGALDTDVFEDDALVAIHRYTGGVPGAVSALCEQLLDKAASAGTRVVTAALVARVFGDPPPQDAAPRAESPPQDEPKAEPKDEREDASSLIDHSNTPLPVEDAAVQIPAPLPQFGNQGGSARAPEPLAAPEPELEVQQGLLPIDEGSNYANESDFFGGAPARTTSDRRLSAPLASAPGSGRSARAVRNLILLAVVAVGAAVAHAWWEDFEASVLDLTPSKPEAVVHETPAADAIEDGIHPLIPPNLRDLARRSLELENSQGRRDDLVQEGLTSDLKLDLSGDGPNAADPAAAPADPTLSLSELYDIAEKAKPDGREDAGGVPSPWTQQGPATAPAAPAPTR